jgi:hypothetical protein
MHVRSQDIPIEYVLALVAGVLGELATLMVVVS